MNYVTENEKELVAARIVKHFEPFLIHMVRDELVDALHSPGFLHH